MKLKSVFITLFLILTGFLSCQKEPAQVVEEFDVQLEIPGSVEVPSDTRMLQLNVIGGKAPVAGDQLLLQGRDGRLWPCEIKEISTEKIEVFLQNGIVQGDYHVYVRRGQEKKLMKFTTMFVKFFERIDFTPDEGVTIYGKISCNGNPVPGVVVSDGVLVTATDQKGIYQLKSRKERETVFMSVPSGYEPVCEGILPQLWCMLKEDPKVMERVDFKLKEAGDQTNYKLLVLGDLHLAIRTGDIRQFDDFAKDMNAYLAAHRDDKVYALTLGDMTWDIYWYDEKFGFPEYLDLMNSKFKDICVYHTMGNHDNDFKGASDFLAEDPYLHYIAPNYYSFNIGKVHYVVLDNIDCSLYDGTTSRRYFVSVTDGQLEWLKKDLKYVSKDTPIILTTHAPVTRPYSPGVTRYNYTGADRLFDVLNGYKVDIITGHTHKVFNVDTEAEKKLTGVDNIFEHNGGAVCATWWWSAHMTPGIHISVDGSHGGYGIWDIDGKDISWLYKATGKSESHQFHAYDLNEVKRTVTMELGSNKPKFEKYVHNADAYPYNAILLNIWNYNPSWKITVTENGKELPVKMRFDYDPLHIIALTAKRFATNDDPMFTTSWSDHFFEVQATSSDSTLEIVVEDEFGHVFKETMKRPKEFTAEIYRQQP